ERKWGKRGRGLLRRAPRRGQRRQPRRRRRAAPGGGGRVRRPHARGSLRDRHARWPNARARLLEPRRALLDAPQRTPPLLAPQERYHAGLRQAPRMTEIELREAIVRTARPRSRSRRWLRCTGVLFRWASRRSCPTRK